MITVSRIHATHNPAGRDVVYYSPLIDGPDLVRWLDLILNRSPFGMLVHSTHLTFSLYGDRSPVAAAAAGRPVLVSTYDGTDYFCLTRTDWAKSPWRRWLR